MDCAACRHRGALAQMAPTTALGLARRRLWSTGRIWAYTEGAEPVYVDGTVQNIDLKPARGLASTTPLTSRNLRRRPRRANQTRAAGQLRQGLGEGEG